MKQWQGRRASRRAVRVERGRWRDEALTAAQKGAPCVSSHARRGRRKVESEYLKGDFVEVAYGMLAAVRNAFPER